MLENRTGKHIMVFHIDFDSKEAIYVQLCRQIVFGIASGELSEGASLPSVRELAASAGINMHTVNKAYAILREEGFLTLDRRKGAVVVVNKEKAGALSALQDDIETALAKARCRGVTKAEIHELIDELYQEYEA